jgi:hypothetical protein
MEEKDKFLRLYRGKKFSVKPHFGFNSRHTSLYSGKKRPAESFGGRSANKHFKINQM